MKKILFVYDNNKPERLKENGLWKALDLLEKDFEITRFNRATESHPPTFTGDFILGWGGFTSRVDELLINTKTHDPERKIGLCLSAYFPINETAKNYDIIFCETENTRMWLDTQGIKQTKHAFGINTEIFKFLKLPVNSIEGADAYHPVIWDNISVGSFSKWHRQDLLYDIPGNNLAVGEIDIGNIQEAFNYIANLTNRNWAVSNWVEPQILAQYYNMSKRLVATADFGQERSVLEARSCGIDVQVPESNPKLKELVTSPIYDIEYYYKSLKEGIESCL